MITSGPEPISFIASQDGQLFEFSGIRVANFFTRSTKTDLLTGKKSSSGLEELIETMKGFSLDGINSRISVFHLFYELGLLLDERVSNALAEDTPLGLYFEFETKIPYQLKEATRSLEVDIVGPDIEVYRKAFTKGLEHLKRGDCYQYNLTFPFDLRFEPVSPESFLARAWAEPSSIGEYASFTYIKSLDMCLFSNSPECLFKTKRINGRFSLETFPIKGTRSIGEDGEKLAWQKLVKSEKDEAELMMITDLLRNDLTRLSGSWATILAKREKLVVPGLVHSFSHIQAELEASTSIYEIMQSLFPGGSITGAPKIRVMEILESLESGLRGFYCGSTLIQEGESLSGSINIRSGSLNSRAGYFRYHSGCGITVLSQVEEEFQEMWDKVRSFSDLLAASH